MAGRGPQTFKKKQKEQQRKEKQQEKVAKREERRRVSEAAPPGERVPIDYDYQSDDFGIVGEVEQA